MSDSVEEKLKWWREARYGMFIHWGLYSLLAGEWKGVKAEGIGEWIMYDQKIPVDEYATLAKDFNPLKFDAEQWAELALQAGMKYMVVTAKHHDGFCMFDSPSNAYNIVAKTPFKRDPMKELAEACNKRGIKMCFYYSQAQDWYAPGGAGHWEDEISDGEKRRSGHERSPEDFQRYLDGVVKPNLRELLTQYGPVGLIWFDTPVTISKTQSLELKKLVQDLQPECLVSGRVGHDVGDYGSLGDNEHPSARVRGAWESPATLNDTWGYKLDDHNWKSVEVLLDLLINCASKDVNYLLNIGPTAEGVIPQPSVDILKEIGAWLSKNGEAIYGTSGSPFPVDPKWGKITNKENVLYLLVKDWPRDDRIHLLGLKNGVQKVYPMGHPKKALKVEQDGGVVTIALPSKATDRRVSVIVVELEGEPQVEDVLFQEVDGRMILPVHVARIKGEAKIGRAGNTENWKNSSSNASWFLRVHKPGSYELCAITFGRKRVPERFGNHELEVRVAGQVIAGVAGIKDLDLREDAPGPQKPRSVLGQVIFDRPGEYELLLCLKQSDPKAEAGLNLFAIEMTPLGDEHLKEFPGLKSTGRPPKH